MQPVTQSKAFNKILLRFKIGNVYVKQIENLSDGSFDLEKFESMISDYSDSHCARTRVVCIENTHNNCGGRVLPLKFLDELRNLCNKHGVKIHLDGSRLMNASLACNVGVNELTKHCDSVNFCFSKVNSPYYILRLKLYILYFLMFFSIIGFGSSYWFDFDWLKIIHREV